MSLESRFKSASLFLLQAAAELVPLPQNLIDQRHGLLFARATQGYQLSAAVGAALELDVYRFLEVPRKLSEVAEHTQMTPEAAEVLLDALKAAGLCCRTGEHFELTRIGRQQFLTEHWTAGRGMVEFMLGAFEFFE